MNRLDDFPAFPRHKQGFHREIAARKSLRWCSMLCAVPLVAGMIAGSTVHAQVPTAQPSLHGASKSPAQPAQFTAPKLLDKREPEFSQAARDAGVSGTVILSFIVDPDGIPRQVTIVRPIGFGLDDKAVEALKHWRFAPATLNGKPVNAAASADLNFRLVGQDPNSNLERLRGRYRSAMKRLCSSPDKANGGVSDLKDLADEQFPPALYSYGRLLEEGKCVSQDLTRALDLYRLAAIANDGNAIARLALPVANGKLEGDREEAIRQLQKAADLGARDAQFWLGTHYLAGNLLPKDRQQGEQQLRLCAAYRDAQCQFAIGRSMLERLGSTAVGVNSPPYLEALALLQLAEAGRVEDATPLLEPHLKRLDSRGRQWVERLQSSLVHPAP